MSLMKNDKFRAGILYCGGCNPYFDREELFREIEAEFSEVIDFRPYKETEPFDIILLINGCQSECLMEVDYSGKLIVLNDKNYKNFSEEIKTAVLSLRKKGISIK